MGSPCLGVWATACAATVVAAGATASGSDTESWPQLSEPVVEKWAGTLSMSRRGIAHDVPLNLTLSLSSAGALDGTADVRWAFDHNNAGSLAFAFVFAFFQSRRNVPHARRTPMPEKRRTLARHPRQALRRAGGDGAGVDGAYERGDGASVWKRREFLFVCGRA